jgi:hypothetical protein
LNPWRAHIPCGSELARDKVGTVTTKPEMPYSV